MNIEETMKDAALSEKEMDSHEVGLLLVNRSTMRSIESCILASLIVTLEQQGDVSDRAKRDFENKAAIHVKNVYGCSDELAEEIVAILLVGAIIQLMTKEPVNKFIIECADRLSEDGFRPRFMHELCMAAKHG
jgi:hypothetical protein